MKVIGGIPEATQSRAPIANQTPLQDFAEELAKGVATIQTSGLGAASANGKPAKDIEDKASVVATEPALPSMPVSAVENAAPPSAITFAMQLNSAAKGNVAGTVSTAMAAVAQISPGLVQMLQQARIYGLHAYAEPYLSEWSVSEKDIASNLETSERSIGGENVFADLVAETNATQIEYAQSSRDPSSPQDFAANELAAAASSSPADRDAISSTEVVLTSSAATVADNWSDRSLRFIRQRDGSSVAWLRDFKMGANETPPLIRMVLNEARANGVSLARIMLNGNEVWTSGHRMLTGDEA